MDGKTQDLAPWQVGETDPGLPGVLQLIRESFAYMDRLTVADLSRAATKGEIWAIGPAPDACVILTPKPDALYLGKLAVSAQARGQGLARRLVDHAAIRARALGLPALELQTRVELVENHATFARLGFVETGRTAHAGYARPTSITMRRPLD